MNREDIAEYAIDRAHSMGVRVELPYWILSNGGVLSETSTFCQKCGEKWLMEARAQVIARRAMRLFFRWPADVVDLSLLEQLDGGWNQETDYLSDMECPACYAPLDMSYIASLGTEIIGDMSWFGNIAKDWFFLAGAIECAEGEREYPLDEKQWQAIEKKIQEFPVRE